MNDEALANMFPSMVVTPTTEPAEPASPVEFMSPEVAAETAAALVFPSMRPADPPPEELPPEIKSLRDADPARAMFDDRSFYTGAGLDTALKELGIEGRAAEAEHKTWAGVFADLGLSSQEATDMVTVGLMDEPTAEVLQGWPAQAEAALKEQYGDADWQQALADARLLVGRDPRLKDFLNRTQLGNHPRVVKLAAERARTLIASGKLKRKA